MNKNQALQNQYTHIHTYIQRQNTRPNERHSSGILLYPKYPMTEIFWSFCQKYKCTHKMELGTQMSARAIYSQYCSRWRKHTDRCARWTQARSKQSNEACRERSSRLDRWRRKKKAASVHLYGTANIVWDDWRAWRRSIKNEMKIFGLTLHDYGILWIVLLIWSH